MLFLVLYMSKMLSAPSISRYWKQLMRSPYKQHLTFIEQLFCRLETFIKRSQTNLSFTHNLFSIRSKRTIYEKEINYVHIGPTRNFCGRSREALIFQNIIFTCKYDIMNDWMSFPHSTLIQKLEKIKMQRHSCVVSFLVVYNQLYQIIILLIQYFKTFLVIFILKDRKNYLFTKTLPFVLNSIFTKFYISQKQAKTGS